MGVGSREDKAAINPECRWSCSRAAALQELDVPTLVVHGLDDTLIDPSGGRRTAELVPGAQLLLVEDMGHDRPPTLWPLLAEAITNTPVRLTSRGDAARDS